VCDVYLSEAESGAEAEAEAESGADTGTRCVPSAPKVELGVRINWRRHMVA
jgi:hypothetical protein